MAQEADLKSAGDERSLRVRLPPPVPIKEYNMEYKILFEVKTENGLENREVVYHLGSTTTVHDALLLFQEEYKFEDVVMFTLQVRKR